MALFTDYINGVAKLSKTSVTSLHIAYTSHAVFLRLLANEEVWSVPVNASNALQEELLIFGTHARSNAMNWEISKYFATPNAIQNSDTFQLLDTMLKQLNRDHGATLRLGGGGGRA